MTAPPFPRIGLIVQYVGKFNVIPRPAMITRLIAQFVPPGGVAITPEVELTVFAPGETFFVANVPYDPVRHAGC